MFPRSIRALSRGPDKSDTCHVKPQRVPLSAVTNSVVLSEAAIEIDRPTEPPVPLLIHVEIPIGNPADPQDVTEYEHIIYRSMRQREASFPKTLVLQTEISMKDRNCLVDWMCRLHYKIQIAIESLFRAVGILDRAIALTRISRHRLHLIGAACLLVASKIEDSRPMTVGDAAAVGRGEYTPQDLLKMEIQICNLTGFDMQSPTILVFLIIFLRLNGQTLEFMLLARYIAELCLSCGDFVGVKASALAATSMVTTRTLAGLEPWTEELAMYTQFPFEELCGYCRIVHQMLLQADRKESSFIRRKYASDPFCHVANVPVPATLPLAFRLHD
jgi:hypothetical protein